MNKWGLVTAWGVEAPLSSGRGTFLTSSTHEHEARARFERLRDEEKGEVLLWSPRGIEARLEAVCEHCVRLGYPYQECHTRRPA